MNARSLVLVLAAGLAVAPALAQPRLSKQDADRFQAKLTRIVQFGNTPAARTAAARQTQLTDAEVNSYLKFLAGSQVPVGVVDPTINALGDGRVSGRAVVDLDAVRRQKQRGWLDPLGYLSGRLPVTASGRLATRDGVGQFTLDSAEISGVNVPKAVLQELVSYYSRTPERPSGIDMDDPFELPARIREIAVGSGTATVIQ
jgi:hypothetical protein